ANENPSKAINGTWNGGGADKWCDNRSPQKWWQVDLGASVKLDKIVVHNAGDGGESSDWNTQDYTISVSADGNAWTEVAKVTGNSASSTTSAITAVNARYLRL